MCTASTGDTLYATSTWRSEPWPGGRKKGADAAVGRSPRSGSAWSGPRRRPRTSLTLDRIAAAAVEVADEEGVAAVTMRRLATKLGVAPMAAYRHVSGKDDLWALMVDRVAAEI